MGQLEMDYLKVRKYFKYVVLLLCIYGGYRYGFKQGYTRALEDIIEKLQGAPAAPSVSPSPSDGEPGKLDHSHDNPSF